MLIVACLEAVALVVLVVLFLHHIQSIQDQAAAERRELANRIQAPDRLPPLDVSLIPLPQDDELDEIDLVGTVMEPKTDG